MGDARSELSEDQRRELDKMVREMIRGSVVEDAIVRFISQIMAETHQSIKEARSDE